MTNHRRSNTRQRSMRFGFRNFLKNPMTLRWGLFLIAAAEAIRKWV
jgi:hypothetical protein